MNVQQQTQRTVAGSHWSYSFLLQAHINVQMPPAGMMLQMWSGSQPLQHVSCATCAPSQNNLCKVCFSPISEYLSVPFHVETIHCCLSDYSCFLMTKHHSSFLAVYQQSFRLNSSRVLQGWLVEQTWHFSQSRAGRDKLLLYDNLLPAL